MFFIKTSVFMTVYMFPFFWKLLLWVYLATSAVLDSSLHRLKINVDERPYIMSDAAL